MGSKLEAQQNDFFFAVMILFNMAANFVHPVAFASIMDMGLNDYIFGLTFAAMMAFQGKCSGLAHGAGA